MSDPITELKQLWEKNFSSELAPSEEARLAVLMSDDVLMETFSDDQAMLSFNEGAEAASMSDTEWRTINAKVFTAFRKFRPNTWLKPVAITLFATLAIAGGIKSYLPDPPVIRPNLSQPGGSFHIQYRDMEAPAETEVVPSSREVRSTKISVVLEQAKQGPAAVRILNASGAEVRSLFSGDLKPGKYRYEWNGMDSSGSKVAPGAYTIETKNSKGVEKRELEIREKNK